MSEMPNMPEKIDPVSVWPDYFKEAQPEDTTLTLPILHLKHTDTLTLDDPLSEQPTLETPLPRARKERLRHLTMPKIPLPNVKLSLPPMPAVSPLQRGAIACAATISIGVGIAYLSHDSAPRTPEASGVKPTPKKAAEKSETAPSPSSTVKSAHRPPRASNGLNQTTSDSVPVPHPTLTPEGIPTFSHPQPAATTQPPQQPPSQEPTLTTPSETAPNSPGIPTGPVPSETQPHEPQPSTPVSTPSTQPPGSTTPVPSSPTTEMPPQSSASATPTVPNTPQQPAPSMSPNHTTHGAQPSLSSGSETPAT